MKYIAETYNPELLGKTPEIEEEVTAITEKLKSMHDRMNLRCYCKYTLEDLNAYDTLKPIAEILGDKDFVAGNDLTYVDFFMLEMCEYGQYLSQGELYSNHENLEKYAVKMKEM